MIMDNDNTGVIEDSSKNESPNKQPVKEKVKTAKTLEDMYSENTVFSNIAKLKLFEYMTLSVISINAIWIGFDTNNNPAAELAKAQLKFVVAENIFCFYFTFELIIRFLAFELKFDCLRDFWFRFDFVLVTFMVVETWVIPLANSSGGVQVGALRLFRLLRLTRMTRLMRSLPELLTLIKGMKAASRSVASTLILLIIIVYVFGIIFQSQYADYKDDADTCLNCKMHWGTVSDSMFTLLVGGTLLDDITALCHDILGSPNAELMFSFFMLYFVFSHLTVFNMLIGVVCEVISETASTESENSMVAQVTQILTVVFEEIDADGSGMISKKEFELMTDKHESIEALHILGVEPKHLLALSDTIFDSGEDSGGTKEIGFDEFLEMVVHLRPENNASVLDIAQLRGFQRRLMLGLEQKVLNLTDSLDPTRYSLDGQALKNDNETGMDDNEDMVTSPRMCSLEKDIHRLHSEVIKEKEQAEAVDLEILRTQREIKQLLALKSA